MSNMQFIAKGPATLDTKGHKRDREDVRVKALCDLIVLKGSKDT